MFILSTGELDLVEQRIDWTVFEPRDTEETEEEKEERRNGTGGPPESICSHPCKPRQYKIQVRYREK